MTTPSTERKAGPLLGTGAQNTWPFTFKVFAATDIAVTTADSLGVETALVYGVDYSVTLNANQETSPGGTVTYPTSGAALPVGKRLVIIGNLPYDQPLDLPSGGNFSPLALENQLDRLTMQIQQLRENVGRALQLPVTAAGTLSVQLPQPEPNELLGWDPTGQNLQNFAVSELATAVAYATMRYDTFTGDGADTQFPLTADPVTLANLDVAIGGVTQTPGSDYSLVSGVLVFASAPPNGAEILARYGEGLVNVGGDSSDIRFLQAGTGAVPTDVENVLRRSVSPEDFGAIGDGVADDTAAIQAAITYVGSQDAFNANVKSLQLNFATNKKYYVAGTLYLPSYVRIDLNGATLTGQGTNTLFESAYFSGGVPVTNFGQTNETRFVVCSSVVNGQISNFNRAFVLFNFCEGSYLENLRLVGCNQAVYAKRCFYSSVSNVHSRSPLDGLVLPCFHFDDAVNAIRIQHTFAVGYLTGWEFSGSKDNIYTIDCGAESCARGVVINNGTSALQFRGWYFENLFTAIDFEGTGNHQNVYVDGCWFFAVTNAIEGSTILSGRFSQNNVLNGAAISLAANFSNRMVVEIPTDITATNITPSLPANYTLGDANTAEQIKQIYDSGSGSVTNKLRVPAGVIPIHASGTIGSPVSGTVPGATITLGATTATVDTKITFRNLEMVRYAISVTDSVSTYQLSGDVVYTTTVPITGFATKTVTASNNAGFLRLIVSGLSTPSAVTGIVKHI